MKKTLKIVFPILLALILNNAGQAQSFDAKLSLIMYDSFPGYPNSTPYYDFYGGRYRISVPSNNTNVRVTHTIPNTLSDGNGHTIPFSIASNNAAYKLSGNLNSTGAVVFNANNPITLNTAGTNAITFWLGGTVSPPTNAFPSNNYQGTITITAVIL